MADFFGNNKLGARDLLLERSSYRSYALTNLKKIKEPTIETLQIKDFIRNEKIFIGRVDGQNNTIFPSTRYLRQFGQGVDNVAALSFVVGSFNDMKVKFDKAVKTRQISADSPVLGSLIVKKAYINPLKEYNSYIKKRQKQFLRYINRHGRSEKVRDLQTFMPMFLDFIRETSSELPITRTGYLLTKYVSPLTSGLIVEVWSGEYSNDRKKTELFYKDRNFEYLKNLAYSHGFVIDKNIPWRLVADLDSPRMTPYLQDAFGGENPSSAIALNLAFSETYPDDIPSLIGLVTDFYNLSIRNKPTVSKRKSVATSNANGNGTVCITCKSVDVFSRKPLDKQDIMRQSDISTWLKIYVLLRNYETQLLYDKPTLKDITERSIDLAKKVDRSTAVRYIRSKFNNVEQFEGSQFYNYAKLTASKNSESTSEKISETVRRSVQVSNFVIY
jgi:hypothetical protein